MLLPFRLIAAKNLCECDRLPLTYGVTQSMRSGNPEVVALKINSENVVVRRSALHRDIPDASARVAHQHFRFMRVESRAVQRPVGSVVVSETLVGGEPGAISIDSFDLVQEIAGQSAVFLQEVVPVAAVVAAGSEICGLPKNFVDIAD